MKAEVSDPVSVIEGGKCHSGIVAESDNTTCTVDFPDGDNGCCGFEDVINHEGETLMRKDSSSVKLDVVKYREREDAEKMVELLMSIPAGIQPTRIEATDLGKIRTSKPMESYGVMSTLIKIFGVKVSGQAEIIKGNVVINGEPWKFNKRSDKVFGRITK